MSIITQKDKDRMAREKELTAIFYERLLEGGMPEPKDEEDISDEIYAMFVAAYKIYQDRTGDFDSTILDYEHLVNKLILRDALAAALMDENALA